MALAFLQLHNFLADRGSFGYFSALLPPIIRPVDPQPPSLGLNPLHPRVLSEHQFLWGGHCSACSGLNPTRRHICLSRAASLHSSYCHLHLPENSFRAVKSLPEAPQCSPDLMHDHPSFLRATPLSHHGRFCYRPSDLSPPFPEEPELSQSHIPIDTCTASDALLPHLFVGSDSSGAKKLQRTLTSNPEVHLNARAGALPACNRSKVSLKACLPCTQGKLKPRHRKESTIIHA